jgi:tight adherence protein B
VIAVGLVTVAGACAGGVVIRARRAALDARLGVTPERERRAAPRIDVRVVAGATAVAICVVAGPIVGSVGVAAAVLGALALRRRRAARTARLRADGLPDAASALAAGLRAGLSLPQSLAFARDESVGPLRGDLDRLVSSVDLGEPVGDALLAWADAAGSQDASLLASVVDLHRRTGGDLPSVLDGVVTTLRDRRAAFREVRALTAQARLSGAILGALPIAFFAFLLLTSRHDMLAAIATPLGRTAVAVGLTLELLAFVWIRRLLAVR